MDTAARLTRALGQEPEAHLVLTDHLRERGLALATPRENTAAAVLEAIGACPNAELGDARALFGRLLDAVPCGEHRPLLTEALAHRDAWRAGEVGLPLKGALDELAALDRRDLLMLALPHRSPLADVAAAAQLAAPEAVAGALGGWIGRVGVSGLPLADLGDSHHPEALALLRAPLFLLQHYAANWHEETVRYPRREGLAPTNDPVQWWDWRVATSRYALDGLEVVGRRGMASLPAAVREWLAYPAGARWILDGLYTAQAPPRRSGGDRRLLVLKPRPRAGGPVFAAFDGSADPRVSALGGGSLAERFSDYVLASLGQKLRCPIWTDERGQREVAAAPPLTFCVRIETAAPAEEADRALLDELSRRVGRLATRWTDGRERSRASLQGFASGSGRQLIFRGRRRQPGVRAWQLHARRREDLDSLLALILGREPPFRYTRAVGGGPERAADQVERGVLLDVRLQSWFTWSGQRKSSLLLLPGFGGEGRNSRAGTPCASLFGDHPETPQEPTRREAPPDHHPSPVPDRALRAAAPRADAARRGGRDRLGDPGRAGRGRLRRGGRAVRARRARSGRGATCVCGHAAGRPAGPAGPASGGQRAR